MLTLSQCADAQSLAVGTCGCTGEVVPTDAPVPITTGMPTPAPTPTPAPVAQPFCNVCGGFGRTQFNAVILGGLQCFDVEAMGMKGELDELECIIAQIEVTSSADPCRCTGVPTPHPTPSPTLFPTPEPTVPPTTSPTAFPTAVPTPRPSSSPTPAPTSRPSPSPATASPDADPTESPTAGTSPTLSWTNNTHEFFLFCSI
jgi:hypothetical protein